MTAVRSIAADADAIADEHRLRRRITRDSLWMFSGYAVTAGSGFLFWIVAAMVVPQHELGVDASILSAMAAAAALAASGTGSAMVVMVPASGASGRTILQRGHIVTAIAAAVLGTLAGAFVSLLLPQSLPPVVVIPLVAAGTVVWALFTLQATALPAVGEARATLFVAGGANILKLAAMAALALTAVGAFAHPVLVTTLAPAALAVGVSMFVIVPRAQRREAETVQAQREWGPELSRTFRRFTVHNTVAVGLVLSIGLSLSFLVAVLSSPSQGAIFAIAYQFGTALDLIGVGVAVSLARSAAADFATSSRLARGFTVRLVVTVAAMGIAVTAITPVMFLLLGPEYDPLYGVAVVGALAAASVVRPGYDVWSALVRAQHRVRPVLFGNAVYAAIVIALVILTVPTLGALGAALAVFGGACALAVIGVAGLRRVSTTTPQTLRLEGATA
ncbi:lipopolysaccharide biosynthesis protein [Microbacterium sp.]|uniref:lipopolysaccharide biosynthesis protein n=1 Tax=Microbacterium sp. TaxID=51671 RepID=UPI003C7510B2